MTDMSNMYFYYIKINYIIQVEGVIKMIIGICGKSGSGKSTLSNLIKEEYKNVCTLEIDKVGHNALLDEAVKKELVNNFGFIIIEDNKVNRKKLGEIVFNSRHQMDRLTEITWNHMEKEIDNFIENNKDKIIILDWLLLPKTKFFNECDIKILLDIPYEVRLQRAMKRDNITKEAFDLRDNSSIEFDPLSFDYVYKDNKEINIKRLVKRK